MWPHEHFLIYVFLQRGSENIPCQRASGFKRSHLCWGLLFPVLLQQPQEGGDRTRGEPVYQGKGDTGVHSAGECADERIPTRNVRRFVCNGNQRSGFFSRIKCVGTGGAGADTPHRAGLSVDVQRRNPRKSGEPGTRGTDGSDQADAGEERKRIPRTRQEDG